MLQEFNVFDKSLKDIDLDHVRIINTINPHSYCEAKKDPSFKEALKCSDILLPDGQGIVLATRILYGKRITKIAGADIHEHLLKEANKKGLKVFYLGASANTLSLIEKRIQKDYPNIKVHTFSPPFKASFSKEDTSIMINEINLLKPDILFVGMTAPKQEKWVFSHNNKIETNLIVSIGAVFDFYAGTVKRSGAIWIKLGLEWLPRLIKEPRRLWRRNFISTPLFLRDMINAKYMKKF
ncbi:WecB/TagA/CpsF family glycosyltransferase [Seonamhaeicola sp. MEBiC1930]|uniref:WecB/TagA/CpsF family glycosyltransferase n=1 Tax=Seonamhaeicola sp. MEBiC01930 TaxID=2976768 RepID=UPI0032480C53